MALNNPTYSEIYDRILKWMDAHDSENFVREYINRAQDKLQMYRPWEMRVFNQSLSLTNKQASLPSDFYRVVNIGWDSNSDGLLDGFYYRYGDVDKGYYVTDDFTKAAGHSYTITMFADVSQTPILQYQKVLEDFAGTGTEYSFFPKELIITTAQMIRLSEEGAGNNEYQAIKIEQKDNLTLFVRQNWANSAFRFGVRDINHNRIALPDINLRGDGRSYQNPPFSRSTDIGSLYRS